MFYEKDIPETIYELEKIADGYGIRITDVDIWSLAKCSENPPHLGNVYVSLLFRQLAEKINEHYPNLDVDYFINGLDTHFYINQESITSVKQFNELIANN